MKKVQEDELNALKSEIDNEKELQTQIEAQALIVEAKKENVALQQEAAYRERAWQVYNEVSLLLT